ncbi:MAG TPA: hypothetical protein VKV06_08260 [Acidimicrobiales bacterium]|nr:hypothetical protein [Acidimicrobiales bacterium]
MRLKNAVAALGGSLALAGSLLGVAGTANAAARPHTSTSCADNVCIRVVNAAQGSSYIETATVWSPDVTSIPYATLRLLYNGSVQATQNSGSGTATFGIYAYLPKGLCIQGGDIGVGRSSCWVVP